MNSVFLSIGSNIEPERNVPACMELLKKSLKVLKFSPVYETDPVGPAGPHKFWNLAAQIEGGMERKKLVEKLRGIETALGRVRDPANKFAPRNIDIDLLPQPDYQNQAFIMVPLADIAPKEKDPETGKTFAELAAPIQKSGLRRVSV